MNVIPRGLPVSPGRDRSRTSFLEACQSYLAETGQEHHSLRPANLTWQRQVKNIVPRGLSVSPGRDRLTGQPACQTCQSYLAETGQEHHSSSPVSLTWQRRVKNIVPRGLSVSPGRDSARTSFLEACQSHLAETGQERY